MEKRIKLIYILSLLSALVAIGVQGYWLYNQYYYEAERYADEVAADVLRVGDEEFAGRKKVALGDDTSFILGRNSQTKSKQDTVSRNVLTQLSLNFDRKGMPDTANEDQVNITKLRISFDPYLPEDSIIHGVERSVSITIYLFGRNGSTVYLGNVCRSMISGYHFCRREIR